ncbi:MAG: GntR family transcriptional regulator [Candidatus Riflebacteria bacterium HGW-Riflebacteria-1]|jgi:GntR family transcriptional regulator|nr:MAG: GntR family transcriptional regulator [Candidatus Riflebacteria bacterium HGW-Riflebacteria-1]
MIRINESSPVPIYQQIIEGMQREILAGVFAADDRLPSIRDLAVALKVNPNTISRAYQELANTGTIYFKRGQGAFVTQKSTDDLLEQARGQMEKHIIEIVAIARSMNLDRQAVRKIFDAVLEQQEAK